MTCTLIVFDHQNKILKNLENSENNEIFENGL